MAAHWLQELPVFRLLKRQSILHSVVSHKLGYLAVAVVLFLTVQRSRRTRFPNHRGFTDESAEESTANKDKGVVTQFTNWAQCVTWRGTLFMPRTEPEIVALIQRAVAERKQIRVVGACHSFSPAHTVANDRDIVLSLDHMDKLLQVDRARMTVRVQAGIRLAALVEVLANHSVALANTGTILEQSVAGAISTGTHGTGAKFGSLSTQVVHVRLLTPAGAVDCSREQFPDVFRAACLSLGCLGVITEVSLKVVPAFRIHAELQKAPFEEVLCNLDSYLKNNDHFKIWWLPHQEGCWLWLMNRTSKPEFGSRLAQWWEDFQGWYIHPYIGKILSHAVFLVPHVNGLMQHLFSRSERICRSDKGTTYPTHAKHREMAYNIPIEHAADACRLLRSIINTHKFTIDFPIEIRFYKADDLLISPAFGRDTCNLNIMQVREQDHEVWLRTAEEEIVRRYSGRPHWGKIHYMTTEQLRQAFPNWEQFRDIQRTLDPAGRFLNPYTERLLGNPTEAMTAPPVPATNASRSSL